MSEEFDERDTEEPPYDPWLQRRRLVFDRASLGALLGLLDDVHVIGVHVMHEPNLIEVTVSSPRFGRHPEGQEARVEVMEWVIPVPEFGLGRMVFEGMVEYGPVQHPVEFVPTWIEGWRMAMEWLREQGGEYLVEAANEMETRLPE